MVVPQQVSKWILAGLLLIFSSFPAFSQVSPVKDDLKLLTAEEQKNLNKKLSSHKVHVGVVIKHSENIEDDALNYGRGPHGVDIVVWYSPGHTDKEGTKHGGKVRMEVGTYKEGELPDMLADEIIKENLQLLREKKYYEFFSRISDGIYQKLNEAPETSTTSSGAVILVVILLVIGWIALFIICPDCAMILLYFIPMLARGGSNGDFSGGGSSSDE